jgi:hypothetical protein
VTKASCEAADVNLLNPVVLELYPIVCSCSRHIRAGSILSDYSFQASLAGYIEQCLSLSFDMVAELNPGRGSLLNQLLKYLLTAKQWKPPQVASVQVKKVEDVVNKMIFFSSLR